MYTHIYLVAYIFIRQSRSDAELFIRLLYRLAIFSLHLSIAENLQR